MDHDREVMNYIVKHELITPVELAKCFQWTEMATKRHLRVLRERGLVWPHGRVRSTEKGRSLTNK